MGPGGLFWAFWPPPKIRGPPGTPNETPRGPPQMPGGLGKKKEKKKIKERETVKKKKAKSRGPPFFGKKSTGAGKKTLEPFGSQPGQFVGVKGFFEN